MRIGEAWKAIAAFVTVGWTSFQQADGHGTWQHTVIWTLGPALGAAVLVFLVPNDLPSPVKKLVAAGTAAVASGQVQIVQAPSEDGAQGQAGLS